MYRHYTLILSLCTNKFKNRLKAYNIHVLLAPVTTTRDNWYSNTATNVARVKLLTHLTHRGRDQMDAI